MLVPILATAPTATLAMPWLWSGSRSRDAWETLRSARSIGIDDQPTVRVLLALALALPVIGSGCWLAYGTGRMRLAAALAGLAGLVAVGAGSAVHLSDLGGSSAPLAAGGGATSAILIGTVAISSGLVLWRAAPNDSRTRTSP